MLQPSQGMAAMCCMFPLLGNLVLVLVVTVNLPLIVARPFGPLDTLTVVLHDPSIISSGILPLPFHRPPRLVPTIPAFPDPGPAC